MFGSIDLGRLFGIRVRASWTFVLLILLLVWLGSGGGMAVVAWLGMLLLSVLLHELGHALVAQSFGIRVVDITFWPLGGMARMSEIPESPRIEGWIASAGPLVNFALALFALPVALVAEGAGGGLSGASLASKFIAINLVLGTFNLLPAFPMDGGRLLRAALATRVDWVSATAAAVRIGRLVAVVMVVFGIVALWPSGLFLMPLLGAFVWIAGASELVQVRLRHGLPPLEGMAFGRSPFAPGAGWHDPDTAPEAEPSAAGERRREGAWDLELDGSPGFSDEDVRRIEGYRGRLRRDLGGQ